MPEITPSAPVDSAPSAATNGEQPSETPAKQAPTQDTRTPEERARAILKGEIPADDKSGPAEDAPSGDGFEYVDDPGEEPTPTETETATETAEAKAEREEAEEAAREAEAEAKRKEKGEPKKIRINRDRMNDRDFAIIRLMDDQGISYRDAEKRLFPETAKVEESVKSTPKGPTVDEITAKITEKRTERRAASDLMDIGKVNDLNDEISDLIRSRDKLEARIETERERAQQSRAHQYQAEEKESIDSLVEMFPGANTQGDALFEAMRTDASSRKADDPLFASPDWPIILGVKIARKIGYKNPEVAKPVVKAPVVPKKPSSPATITPSTGNMTGVPIDKTAVLQARLAKAKSTNDGDEAKAVLRELMTSK